MHTLPGEVEVLWGIFSFSKTRDPPLEVIMLHGRPKTWGWGEFLTEAKAAFDSR